MYPKIKNKFVLVAILGIIGVVGLIILVCVMIITSRKNRFEDIPTTTFDIANAPTVANKNASCGNPTDMVNICMNLDSCCNSKTTNENSSCFCNHPFVSGCNDAYKACIAEGGSGGDTSNCESILKECCGKYSSTDILSTNFQKPIDVKQSSNQICNLKGIPNLEQRCMELCQTNPACKAYSLSLSASNYSTSLGSCTLYDNVNYDKGKKDDSNIYVIKK
jgi:hypothetical protein